MTQFHTVMIDPPWPERGAGKIKRGADRHYALLKITEMEAVIRGTHAQLGGCPYWDQLGYDAHCYLWTTNTFLPDALQLMCDLGFTYKTNVVWVKLRQETALQRMFARLFAPAIGVAPGSWAPWLEMLLATGLGQYFRGQHEILLFGVRGHGYATKTEHRGLRSVMLAPRGRHSEKPDRAYELVRMRSKGPYLELFGRRARSGWTVWGTDAQLAAGDDAAQREQ